MLVIFCHTDRWNDSSEISKYYGKIWGGGKKPDSQVSFLEAFETLREIKS